MKLLPVAILVSGLCLGAQDPAPVTVSGKVSNVAGQPLAKANVTLRRNSAASPGTFSAVSGPDGTFEITGATAGTYFLYAERTGYMPQGYNMRPGVQFPTGTRSTLNLTAGQSISGRDIQMVAATTLSGKVLDEDQDPVAGVQVRVFRRAVVFGAKRLAPTSQATTDQSGEYRVSNLPPGKYVLAASPPKAYDIAQRISGKPGEQDTSYVQTFYPGTADVNAAANVETFAGRDLGGMHISLKKAPVFHVRGRVDGVPKGPLLRVYAAQREDLFLASYAGGALIKDDGTYDLPDVSAGPHAIVVMNPAEGGRCFARRLITITRNDVNDFAIQALPPIVIQGHIQVEGDEPPVDPANPPKPPQFRVSLGMREGLQSGGAGNILVADDGTFVSPRLNPGEYILLLSGGPVDGYWKSTRRGDAQLESNVLNESDGDMQPVDIVYSRNGGVVTGVASGDDGVPVKSGVYLLIPDSETLVDAQIVKGGVIPAGGQFTIRGIRPGAWHLFAPEENDFSGTLGLAQLKTMLEGRGTAVTVKEKEIVQAAVTIVSAADVEKLAEPLQQ